MTKTTLTNKSESEIHYTIVIKTCCGWTWYESAGTKILGGREDQEQF